MSADRRLAHDWFPEPLPGGVCLGERSWLYSSFAFRHFASVRPDAVRVGRDTGLYDGTFFDLGPEGRVHIGDYCTVVGAIVCSNGLVTLDDYVFVAHEVVIADRFAAVPGAAGCDGAGGGDPSVAIGRNAWIGTRAVLLAGARIGADSVVGAGAVVDFEVPPGVVVAGNPARVVGAVQDARP